MRAAMVVMVMSQAAWAKPKHPGRVGAMAGPVALQVSGDDADSDKRSRCREVMRGFGAELDDKAPIKIVITLQTLHNYLKIVSATRGVVFQERLPAWPMKELCQEALARGNAAVAAEKK